VAQAVAAETAKFAAKRRLHPSSTAKAGEGDHPQLA